MPMKSPASIVGMEKQGVRGSGVIRTNSARLCFASKDTGFGAVDLLTRARADGHSRAYCYSFPEGTLYFDDGADFQLSELGVDSAVFHFSEITGDDGL